MASFKPFIVSLLFVIHSIHHIHGAPCGSLDNIDDCGLDIRCQWSGTECYCASQVPLDVIFVMDSSGSMGSNYAKEKNFIIDMIDQGLSEESHAHVLKFSSSVETVYGFWETQWPRTDMFADITSTSGPGGGTYMKTALSEVANIYGYFDGTKTKKCSKRDKTCRRTVFTSGYEGFDRLLVFLTDGQPSTSTQGPCDVVSDLQSIVGEENIIVVIMGSSIDEIKGTIECMVTAGYPNGIPDYNRILEVEAFTVDAFNDARIAADDFLCPGALSVKLTEIRMEQYTNGADVHHSRWIEIFNNGILLDFSADTLGFSGMMTNAAFGGTSCNISLSRGRYLVVYDPSLDIPQCENCKNCTLTAGQCDEAIYWPCDDTTNTDCGSCSWDTDSATASNEVWSQIVTDSVSGTVLTEATRLSADTDWAHVYTGYSTELRSASALPEEATNWDMSCTGRGTPGHHPLNPCNADCIAEVCQAKGDKNATCHATDICDCTLSDGYYMPTSSSSCMLLYAPRNCTVDNLQDAELGTISIIQWTKGSVSNSDVLFEVDDSNEVVTKQGLEALKQYEIEGGTIVRVRTVINDRLKGNVYSEYAYCTVDTAAPTTAPTPTPTQSNADIDTCTAVIEGYNTMTLSWSAAYPKDDSDITAPYSYYIFGNWYAAGDDSSALDSVTTTALSETFMVPSALSPLDINTFGEPQIYVVTVIDNPETGGTDYVRMEAAGEGRVLCDIVTSAPTPNPTSAPTKDPSESPTTDPTVEPTLSPTYGAWNMDSCLVTIPQKGSANDGSLYIRFTYSNEDAAAKSALMEFILNGEQKASARSTSGGSSFSKAVGVTQSDLDEAMLNDGFQARILYDHQPGNQVRSTNVVCGYTTEGPTVSPTVDPTTEPSVSPSEEPSVSPTKKPTTEPTQSPTYEALTLDPCSAELSADKRVVKVTFTETQFKNNDAQKRYPPSTDIYYELRVGPSAAGAYHPVDEPYAEAAEVAGGEKIVQFTLAEEFEFIVGSTFVTVDIAGTYGDRSVLPVSCSLITQEPTANPTTPSPTRFPTSIWPKVRLDLLELDNSVKDGEWGFDGGCINLGLEDDEDERRRRLQNNQGDDDDDQGEDVSVDTSDCEYCPKCFVKEDTNEKSLHIIREPADFEYDVVVTLSVNYLSDDAGVGMSIDDIDTDRLDDKWLALFNGETITQYIVGGTEDNTIVIEYFLKVDDDTEDSREPTEAFEFRVELCGIDESGGATNPVPEELKEQYFCDVGAYYAAAIIMVEQPEIDTFTMATTGEMPMWVWFPIGFAALAIPFVAYLIYRFYKGRKAAEKMEVQRTFELGEAEKQDDVAEFGVRGDQVTNNPLATGAAFEVDKGDVAIDRQLQFEKMNFEVATTEVEHNIFKQDFGPVQAEKHDMDAAPARPATTATSEQAETGQ